VTASTIPTGVPGRLSFVVPTKDSGRTLEACLVSLRAQDYDDVEIIVVDNDSSDLTVEIAKRLADTVVTWGPERSAQRNRGWQEATGALVAFIDSDMVLDPRIAAEAVARFDEETALSGLIIDEQIIGEGFLARCRQLEKAVRTGDPDVEAARVFRVTEVAAVGGFDESMYAFEDWDLADRVAARGGGTGRSGCVIWHDEGRIRLGDAFRKKRYYGRNLRVYADRPASERRPMVQVGGLLDVRLLRSPLLALGLAVLKSVEFLGLLLGGFDARRDRSHAPAAPPL
jgi:glycosyltransferase involved in cell wall biosynthesis